MGYVQSKAPSEIDVAREALVSLFTGCKWVEEGHQTDFLFKHAFENDINSWLWFHLKLASFQFKARSGVPGHLNDSVGNWRPANYQSYFLEDLV